MKVRVQDRTRLFKSKNMTPPLSLSIGKDAPKDTRVGSDTLTPSLTKQIDLLSTESKHTAKLWSNWNFIRYTKLTMSLYPTHEETRVLFQQSLVLQRKISPSELNLYPYHTILITLKIISDNGDLQMTETSYYQKILFLSFRIRFLFISIQIIH